jgi:hypothetical protein
MVDGYAQMEAQQQDGTSPMMELPRELKASILAEAVLNVADLCSIVSLTTQLIHPFIQSSNRFWFFVSFVSSGVHLCYLHRWGCTLANGEAIGPCQRPPQIDADLWLQVAVGAS